MSNKNKPGSFEQQWRELMRSLLQRILDEIAATPANRAARKRTSARKQILEIARNVDPARLDRLLAGELSIDDFIDEELADPNTGQENDNGAVIETDRMIIELGKDNLSITLDDGSKWKVSPVDVVSVATWLPTEHVAVLRDTLGRFTLQNLSSLEKARATRRR